MAIKFANNIKTALAVNIAPSQTTFSVASVAGFPTLGSFDHFYATISNSSGGIEVVKVTSVVGTTLTCLRGQDGTSASNWSSGTSFEIRIPAQALREIGATNGFIYENDITLTADLTITTGKNGMTAGPVTIASGVTVTVPSLSTWTIV